MRAALLLLVLLLIASCGSPAPEKGGRGGVVSLLPSITAWVTELGAADRLIACTEFCEPGRDIPRVPWRGPCAAEAIVRTGADLVLKQKPRTADDPLRRLLEDAGLTVVSLPSETIEDARNAIVQVGRALGLEKAASAYRERFDAALVQARVGAVGKRRPRVLMVYSRDVGPAANVSAAGPGSFLDEVIRYAGGANVLADLEKPYLTVSVETIVRRAPEVIIDASSGAAADWVALRTVPAVRDGRVHALGELQRSLLIVPGPRLPDAVRHVVELLHGRP